MLHIRDTEAANNNIPKNPEISSDEFEERLEKLRKNSEKVVKNTEEELKTLNEMRWKLRYTTLILIAAIIINAVLLYFDTWKFFLYWIMASFIFLMINPFLLMLPTDVGEIKSYIHYFRELKNREKKNTEETAKPDKKSLISAGTADKKEMIKNLSKQRKYFYELFWNLFFINCQPLAPGFLVLFSFSSVFAFVGWRIGTFESYSSVIVIVQSLAIIFFYIAIEYVQPYSRGFFLGMLGMHSRFRKRYHDKWTLGLKYALYAAVIIIGMGLIFIAVILLPGFTYHSFISAEADFDIDIGAFIVIFVLQTIFVRYLQGKYSRVLVYNLLTSKLEIIKTEILPAISKLESENTGDSTPKKTEMLEKINAEIIRNEVMRTDYRSLFGYFPVCLINPDINAIKSLAENEDKKHDKN
ncbi:hypothetical protein J2128_001311 [Methanomicrobium sp. W14]|uniref:hypothetical protein n=1 Tax=Methanomicrobium sp. W14 TaxID=2817839 RepID=UPI001AE959F8|nr:hypothetical protein [Methanomicrobium sp. W14]MBP2133357.1 hypothetical protein [Methanomicrobium sp. W14]